MDTITYNTEIYKVRLSIIVSLNDVIIENICCIKIYFWLDVFNLYVPQIGVYYGNYINNNKEIYKVRLSTIVSLYDEIIENVCCIKLCIW